MGSGKSRRAESFREGTESQRGDKMEPIGEEDEPDPHGLKESQVAMGIREGEQSDVE